MKVAVFSETPTWAASPGADTPLFDLASSHMAWNQRRRCTLECRVAVPTVTENWWEHLVHCQMRLRCATGEHVAHPHLGHSQPSGHLTSISRLSQLHRPGTWSAGRGGCPSCPSPPDLLALDVAHRAPHLGSCPSVP